MNKVMTEVLSTVIPLLGGLALGLALSANLRASNLEARVSALVKWSEDTTALDQVQSQLIGAIIRPGEIDQQLKEHAPAK